jgi:DNA-binding transcriptional LysR family regulator
MASNLLALAGVSVERLRSFCEIVEAGSVVAAANRTGVEQSQYSRQMRDLERALETKLFVKEGKFLRLSKEGLRLAALTQAYFRGLHELAEQSQDGGRPLRLGTAESIMRWVLVPRYPEVLSAVSSRMDVENHRTTKIIEMVENGSLDLGIVRADAVTDEIESEPFPTMKYVLMVPRAVLPEKSATGIREVRQLPMVLIDGDGRFVRNVERLIERNELPVKVAARVESFSLAVELSKVMGAATIVPLQAANEFAADVFASVPIEGMDQLNRRMVVISSKRTAELNPRARRASARLSRLFTG